MKWTAVFLNGLFQVRDENGIWLGERKSKWQVESWAARHGFNVEFL